VEVDIQGFRHAVTILQSRSEWNELLAAAKSIGSADVVKKHVELNAAKKKSGAERSRAVRLHSMHFSESDSHR
jgi:hypothetical protein